MVYGEHLVFALHVHSFWFLLALVAAVLPEPVGAWFPLAAFAYGILAMQRVYRGRLWVTALRAGVVSVAYALTIGLGAIVMTISLLLV